MHKEGKKYLLYFLVLVYVSGAIGFVVRPSFFKPFTPWTLVLTSLVFLLHQPLKNYRYTLSFCAVVLIGFLSEVAGVKTGFFFGHYHYGDALGLKVLEVPLVISLNWGLLVACGILISHAFFKNKILASLFAAALITATDILIEQSAPALDFWYFEQGLAGLHNYFGWFVITFTGSYIFQKNLMKGNRTVAFLVLGLQIFFFGTFYMMKKFSLF